MSVKIKTRRYEKMANKDSERNLNITFKADTDEKSDTIVSIGTIFRKLRKYLIIWLVAAVVGVVGVFGYSAVNTHVRKPTLSAVISFTYDGVEKGLDPNGNTFDVNTIKNPNVINRAVSELGFDGDQVEAIRQAISFRATIPKDIADRLTVFDSILENANNVQAGQAILDTVYYPTQYTVYFDCNKTSMSSTDCVSVFNKVLEVYDDYFYETFGYNEALGSAVNAIEPSDYDYSEAVEVFTTNLRILNTYVTDLSNEDATHFRSSVTGYTFADLAEAISTIVDIDLEKVSSFVTVNNLTKDKEESLAYCDYRIKTLTRTQAKLQEQIDTLSEDIENYKKDDMYVFGAEGSSSETHSTVASEQYDKMLDKKSSLVANLADAKQEINLMKERQEALKSKPEGSDAKKDSAEKQIEALREKVNNMINSVNDTADDYYRNLVFRDAYSVLAPATNSSSDKMALIINNAKADMVLVEGGIFALYFLVAFLEALFEDMRKKKRGSLSTEPVAVSTPLQGEEPKQEEETPVQIGTETAEAN